MLNLKVLCDKKYDMTANKVLHANCELFGTVTHNNNAVIKHGSCICPEIKQSVGIYFLSGQSRKHNSHHEAAMLVNGFPSGPKTACSPTSSCLFLD